MDEKQNDRLDPQVYLGRGKRLLRHVWAHFEEDRCLEEAASLGYTSLLSLVPLLAVVFGIIAAFSVFNEWSEMLQPFIFDNFMPSTGEQVVPYLNAFLDSVSKLTLPGMLTLIVTALLLLIRIETAFNRIWRVDKARTLVNRIVMYWAMLTLVPILIAAAMAFSVQNLFGFIGGGRGARSAGIQLAICEALGALGSARAKGVLQQIGKDTPAKWGIEKWFQGEDKVNLDKGTTLLVFWESWCPHCQREVPKVQALYDALADDGLQVVATGLDLRRGGGRQAVVAVEHQTVHVAAGLDLRAHRIRTTHRPASRHALLGQPAQIGTWRHVTRRHVVRVFVAQFVE